MDAEPFVLFAVLPMLCLSSVINDAHIGAFVGVKLGGELGPVVGCDVGDAIGDVVDINFVKCA